MKYMVIWMTMILELFIILVNINMLEEIENNAAKYDYNKDNLDKRALDVSISIFKKTLASDFTPNAIPSENEIKYMYGLIKKYDL